jgi:hypothetical protein
MSLALPNHRQSRRAAHCFQFGQREITQLHFQTGHKPKEDLPGWNLAVLHSLLTLFLILKAHAFLPVLTPAHCTSQGLQSQREYSVP